MWLTLATLVSGVLGVVGCHAPMKTNAGVWWQVRDKWQHIDCRHEASEFSHRRCENISFVVVSGDRLGEAFARLEASAFIPLSDRDSRYLTGDSAEAGSEPVLARALYVEVPGVDDDPSLLLHVSECSDGVLEVTGKVPWSAYRPATKQFAHVRRTAVVAGVRGSILCADTDLEE